MNPAGAGPSHKPPSVEDPLDRSRFPIDEWRLVETRFDASDLGTTESLFSVGNGYLGLRGNYEESRDFDTNGTFINGFHETWPILHAEEAFGFAKVGQTIVNAPDAKIIRLYVDDEPLELSTADLLEYERVLDLQTGVLTRDVLWRTPSGKRVRVVSRRMVSFTQRHVAVMTFEVTLLDSGAPVSISSQLLNRADGENEHEVLTALKDQGMDPRKAERFSRRVLVPENERGRPQRWSSLPGLPLRPERHDDRRRRRPPPRDHQRLLHEGREPRGHREGDLPHPGRARPHHPAHQDGQLSHRTGRAVPRAARPLRAHARPDPRGGRAQTLRRPGVLPHRLLGAERCRGAGAGGHPAGRALEPLLGDPGGGAGRRRRHPGQGRHRLGVRRPLLLGHRGLRDAVPHVHGPVGRPQRVAVPPHPARLGPRPGPPAHPEGCLVPVAHHQRRGGLGVLRGRYGAVPHRRRHRVRAEPVRRRHR